MRQISRPRYKAACDLVAALDKHTSIKEAFVTYTTSTLPIHDNMTYIEILAKVCSDWGIDPIDRAIVAATALDIINGVEIQVLEP